MRETAYRQFIFQELSQIRDNEELDKSNKVYAIRHLLLRLFELATKEDKLHFNTVYARIAFVAHRSRFPAWLVYQVHRFRRARLKEASPTTLTDLLNTGYKAVIDATQAIFEGDIPRDWQSTASTAYPIAYQAPDVIEYRANCRVVALEYLAEEQVLVVREEERPLENWQIYFAEEQANELVRAAINIVHRVVGLPCTLNLLQVEVLEGQQLSPKQIIVEPDYLIDVTGVAYCYDGQGRTQP